MSLDYNAVVIGTRHVHEELMILRVLPDGGVPQFQPGQYTTLGLRSDEPRVDGVASVGPTKLIRRAYSISHPLVDDHNDPMPCGECEWLEFYIALVRKPDDDPPSLTPRLFQLRKDDRLFVDPKPRGKYTLGTVQPTDDVLLAATGTGEAPHNAMAAELLCRKHSGRIASITTVRYQRDLAYLESHRQLERRFSNYRYVPLTTREPVNLDVDHPDYVGKRYLQDLMTSDSLKDQIGWEPNPTSTHVFLCGNPAMIGVPKRTSSPGVPEGVTDVFPTPPGMIEVLTNLGFQQDRPRVPGNIHFEKYW